jgi:hypothetical protein
MMHHGNDAMMLVRSELCERLEGLERGAARLTARAFVVQVQGMRALAASYGLIPVVRVAQALERAVGEGGRNLRRCPTGLYLARLKDAIGCERIDEDASEALLASVSVRL